MKGIKTRDEWKQYVKGRRWVALTYIVLNAAVVFSLIRAIVLGTYENAFLCIAVLILFSVPHFLKRQFRICLPNLLEIVILLFVFSAEILGELQCYYLQYPHWDIMLHTVWGFLCAAIGFVFIDLLNQDSKLKFNLSPFFVAAAAFCFSMTIGVFWEFFEFGVDRIFHADMQKDTLINTIYSTYLDPTQNNIAYEVADIHQTSVNGTPLVSGGYLDIGLIDTMTDLFVNFIGAFVFSIIGWFYIKHRGKVKFAHAFIPTVAGDKTDK